MSSATETMPAQPLFYTCFLVHTYSVLLATQTKLPPTPTRAKVMSLSQQETEKTNCDSVAGPPCPLTDHLTTPVLERWNHPSENRNRYFATVFGLIVMGLNDACLGAYLFRTYSILRSHSCLLLEILQAASLLLTTYILY